jgi:methionyl-tRNA synthetase
VGRLYADLANDLGNFVSRATTLIANFRDDEVPVDREDAQIRDAFEKARAEVDSAMEEFAFHRALGSIWEFIAILNRYVDTQQPWALAKDARNRDRLDAVLYTLANSLRSLGIILAPFLPDTSRAILKAIGYDKPPKLVDAS